MANITKELVSTDTRALTFNTLLLTNRMENEGFFLNDINTIWEGNRLRVKLGFISYDFDEEYEKIELPF